MDPAGDISSAMGKLLRDGIGEQTPRASPCWMGAHPAPADHRLFQAVKIKEKNPKARSSSLRQQSLSHQVSITRGFGIETPSNGAGGRQGPSLASCRELGLCQHREPYLGQKPSDAAEDGAWFVVSSAPSVSTGGSRLYLLRVQKRKRGKRKKKSAWGSSKGKSGERQHPPFLLSTAAVV